MELSCEHLPGQDFFKNMIFDTFIARNSGQLERWADFAGNLFWDNPGIFLVIPENFYPIVTILDFEKLTLEM